jgi:hypothetical protein
MEKASDGSFPVFFVPAETTIERRAPPIRIVGRGYKAGRFTYFGKMQPCRRRLTLTLPQAPARLSSK